MEASVFCIIGGAFCLAINQRFFYTDGNTGELEDGARMVGYLVTGLAVAIDLCFIHTITSPMCFIVDFAGTEVFALVVVVLITIGLACLNIKNLYARFGEDDEKLLSMFVCAKFSLIVLCILDRADVMSFVIGIVLAIAFIGVGFYYRMKGFRLYGLVLCLVCVAKLLLVDVEYDSSVMRPVGCLTAGLLCYFVSWIYSKLENRIKKVVGR